MKNTKANKLSVKDLLLWLLLTILTALAFYLTYFFNISGPMAALIWIGWFLLLIGIGFFTSKGQIIYQFAKNSKNELQKVVWPSRQETIQTTAIVILMVTFTSLILWTVDSTMTWFIGKLTHLG